ncbi:hypothetical protein MXL54_00015 [Enterobacteriaceae bacterium G50]|nr:hypothetical protein [Enterobacteriaceae bacterium G50]
MPQGVQCWDASGNLVADIGDYNCRYVGSLVISVPASATVVTTSYAGATAAGYFAVPVSVSAGREIGFYYCRAYDGGIRTFILLKYAYAHTVTVNVYAFI